jgi:hypothetical protein
MFAKMAVDYSRSVPRRAPGRAVSPQAASPGEMKGDERAVRDAMDRAIARRLRSKSVD